MAKRLDLFELAARNDPALKARFESELAKMDRPSNQSVANFAVEVSRKAQISINQRPCDLRDALEEGRFYNIYDVARRIQRRSTSTAGEILEGKLREFAPPRRTFDEVFRHAAKFVYGALNIGGLGATRYGSCCIVFSPARLAKTCELAYLGGDSLKTYFLPSGKLDAPKLARDCATDSHKHHLCALKHLAEIAAWPPEHWFSKVCNRNTYVEAVICGDVSTAHVVAVRFSRIDYEVDWHYAFDAYDEPLGELDR